LASQFGERGPPGSSCRVSAICAGVALASPPWARG